MMQKTIVASRAAAVAVAISLGATPGAGASATVDPHFGGGAAQVSRPACTITGTSGDDTLYGTNGPDVICAGRGDDLVYARRGNDIVPSLTEHESRQVSGVVGLEQGNSDSDLGEARNGASRRRTVGG